VTFGGFMTLTSRADPFTVPSKKKPSPRGNPVGGSRSKIYCPVSLSFRQAGNVFVGIRNTVPPLSMLILAPSPASTELIPCSVVSRPDVIPFLVFPIAQICGHFCFQCSHRLWLFSHPLAALDNGPNDTKTVSVYGHFLSPVMTSIS